MAVSRSVSAFSSACCASVMSRFVTCPSENCARPTSSLPFACSIATVRLFIRSRLRTTLERMKSLTVAIEQAKGKLEVGRAQFSLGQVTNLDITDAQHALLNAETDLLTAILGYKSGLADLEAALADGNGLRFWGPQP